MHPLDPWRAAKLLIDQHDERAASMALKRRRELREAGDEAGAAAWTQVLDAIMALRRSPLSGGGRHDA